MLALYVRVPTVRLLTYCSRDYYKRTTVIDSGNQSTLNMSNTFINSRNTKLSFVVYKLQGVGLRKKNPIRLEVFAERHVCRCVSLVVEEKKRDLLEVKVKIKINLSNFELIQISCTLPTWFICICKNLMKERANEYDEEEKKTLLWFARLFFSSFKRQQGLRVMLLDITQL